MSSAELAAGPRAAPELQTGRLVGWLAFVGTFAALNYASRFAGGEPDNDVLYSWTTAVGGAIQFALMLLVVLVIARGHRRSLLALRPPSSTRTALKIGAAIYLLIMVLAGVLSIWVNPGEEQGLLPDRWRPDRAAAFAANAVVVAGVAPIVEELTFRGLGYSLLERFGRWRAILLVGLTFGLAHGLVEALPLLAAFGAGLAYLRSRTHSVYPGIVVHAVFNVLALVSAVAV